MATQFLRFDPALQGQIHGWAEARYQQFLGKQGIELPVDNLSPALDGAELARVTEYASRRAEELSALLTGTKTLGDDPTGESLQDFARSVDVPLSDGFFEDLTLIGLHHPSPGTAMAALWVFTACVPQAPDQVPQECVLYLGVVGVAHGNPQRSRVSFEGLFQIAFFAPEKIGLSELVQVYEMSLSCKEDAEFMTLVREFFCLVACKAPELETALQACRLLKKLVPRGVSPETIEVFRMTRHEAVRQKVGTRELIDAIDRSVSV